MSLSPKQQRFVEEFLVDCNVSAAAKRAGYSEKTAHSTGHDLMKKPEIADAIAAARAEQSKRTGITADRVLEEVARLAFARINGVLDWGAATLVTKMTDDGAVEVITNDLVLKSADAIDADHLAAISELKHTQHGIAVKMHDKGGALDKLMKHLGLFAPEKLEHTGANGGPIQTENLTPTERARRIAFALAAGAKAAKKDPKP